MVALAAVIVVKLDFKAVAVAAIAFHLAERGVPLRAQPDVFIGLAVDLNAAGDILFIGTPGEKALPVL